MGPAVYVVLWKQGGGSRRGPSGSTLYKIQTIILLSKSWNFMKRTFLLFPCWKAPVSQKATGKTEGLKNRGRRIGSGSKLRAG